MISLKVFGLWAVYSFIIRLKSTTESSAGSMDFTSVNTSNDTWIRSEEAGRLIIFVTATIFITESEQAIDEAKVFIVKNWKEPSGNNSEGKGTDGNVLDQSAVFQGSVTTISLSCVDTMVEKDDDYQSANYGNGH